MAFTLEVALIIIGLWATVFVNDACKNIWWHGLSKFPGPRSAAMTSWYKTYYEVIRGVSWTEKLKELHMKYGRSIFDRNILS